MKRLTDLINGLEANNTSVSTDIEINNIQYDSRNILPGDLFVAIKGETSDGHEFIDAAIDKGAAAVICENDIPGITIPSVKVSNSRKALALVSSSYYDNPGKSMKLIGITGTNGKTSTAYLLDNILQTTGYSTGLLGTIKYRAGEEEFQAKWTTPESLEMQLLLSKMREKKAWATVMEVSSHALEQNRIEGLVFETVVFTNLSQDHLDYHRSMERYADAKKRLFRQVDSQKGENVINGDDPVGFEMAKQNHRPVLTYSMDQGKADVFPDSVSYSSKGVRANLNSPVGKINIQSCMVGSHNLYNIMAAVGAGISLGISRENLEAGINGSAQVPGRLESVNAGQPFPVLVDYAHTPDAMEKAITAVRPLVDGRLIVLFGCGGDRDRDKRPQMGRIGEKGADIAILTSDNPRTEDPQQIINDVLEGISDKKGLKVIIDRKEAIHYSLEIAEENDWVLLLGKGHETYQILGTERIDFDDREIAKTFIKEKLQNN